MYLNPDERGLSGGPAALLEGTMRAHSEEYGGGGPYDFGGGGGAWYGPECPSSGPEYAGGGGYGPEGCSG